MFVPADVAGGFVVVVVRVRAEEDLESGSAQVLVAAGR